MANPGNFAPNSMQHPQMAIPNPQTAIPFHNFNALLVPNQFFPMNAPQNFNNPIPMNQINNMGAHNPVAHFFNQNAVDPSQFLNQNLNLGLCFPNQIQNMNQNFPMQLPNFSGQAIVGNCNLPQNGFPASNQLGFGNGMQRPMNLNTMIQTHNASQKLLAVQAFAPFPPQQHQKNFQSLPSKFQGNNGNNDKMQKNDRNLRHKNFLRTAKHETTQDRFTKYQSHNFKKAKGNFSAHPMQSIKAGKGNDDGNKTFIANSAQKAQVVQKRLIPLHYTEQEIQQWREERRKNYPSKSNIEKKLAAKLKEPGTADLDVKLRREQLKEILNKQAELGCEVAEIPACYFSDSEKQVYERKDNVRALNKKEKFQNKFNKRGRFNQDDRVPKKRSFVNRDTPGTCSQTDNLTQNRRVGNSASIISHAASKKEQPTLLQKLLSADIRRDKQHLLQVFKFIVMNSFFKDFPDQALKFPRVAVKGNVLDERSKEISEDIFQECGESTNSHCGVMEKAEADVQAGILQGDERLEEEGEIID